MNIRYGFVTSDQNTTESNSGYPENLEGFDMSMLDAKEKKKLKKKQRKRDKKIKQQMQ